MSIGGRQSVAPDWAGLTVLQCELRAMFLRRPVNRALSEALQRIGQRLGAEYAVVHARLGVHLLTEEWSRPGTEPQGEVRESVNNIVWEAMSNESVRCTKLGEGDGASVVVTAVMYDEDIEQAGAAALVLPPCTEEQALRSLLCLEGALGCLAILVGSRSKSSEPVAEHRRVEPTAAAEHPMRLALAIASDVQHRYGFDLTAVGFVTGHRVDVMAVSGHAHVNQATPGVQVLRAAMAECYDRAAPVLFSGRDAEGCDEDPRLHAQWSATLGGDPVASVPLTVFGEVVAVVSMSKGAATSLDRDRVNRVAEEMSGYAALVPLSRAASRGLLTHLRDSMRAWRRRIAGAGVRRAATYLTLLLGLVAWLAFGSLRFTFTVPCVVRAADAVVTPCPRDGILAELFVSPGDRVHAGQMLAALDANQDVLRRAELRAEIESVEAQADKALAEREFGDLRIHRARKSSLLAQLAVVEANIEAAQIRAPRDGMVLDGDLRERIGARLRAGDDMFTLARYDRAVVVLKVPEQLVLAARDARTTVFSPAADPSRRYDLRQLRVHPASTVAEGKNVFLGEATVVADLDGIAPGMEGVACVDAGPRAAWWVLSHRVTHWLQLNFWL
ncbi:MAG: efflux RND transporter periplasmic adaptor subunit [Planctomycetes bacterium]|nr:efflux RND transporter periplasmic adaptor subunit [Planctomycetota bacterium]MCB9869954.1 efflux RND transporter periplasmic adaptor subunit [Planctomycetota bacterium]